MTVLCLNICTVSGRKQTKFSKPILYLSVLSKKTIAIKDPGVVDQVKGCD